MEENSDLGSSAGEEEREMEGAEDGWQPAGRRGACCFAHEGCIYLFQGYEGRGFLHTEKTYLYRFSLKQGQWEVVQTTGDFNQGSIVSGACCALLGERMVSFGGWIAGVRVADVHQLDLTSMQWDKCAVANPSEGPFLKDKAGMVPYGTDMVCVVGGYGYPSRHHMRDGVHREQQGAQYHWDSSTDLWWTNEVHLFQLSTGVWISPEVTGQRPSPCAAFTLTMVDSCRAVLFGGRQIERRVNHLYILNLDSWHWEGALLPASPSEPWPSERSFHTACSLVDPACVPSPPHHSHPTHHTSRRFDWLPCPPPDLRPSHPDPSLSPRLLVMWGMDNDADPVADCWLLHLDPVAWSKVHIPAVVPYQPRVWHVVGAWHPAPAQAQLLVFGGCTHNMFREPEPRPFCVDGTAVVEFGVPSLYQLCVQYVASMHSLLSPLLPLCLPQHTVRDIELQVSAIKNYSHFCITSL